MIAPRPYQQEAVERARGLIARGLRRVLIVAPTGAGKTVIASWIITLAIALGKRVLFLAHRRELIFQAVRKLVAIGVPTDAVSFIMANERHVPLDDRRAVLRNPTAPVQVASVDTLRNRPKPVADLVFIDEAHRSLANTYVGICAHYERAAILGLTATPYRADGKGLGTMYDELVVVASPQQLIDDGFLVAPAVFTVPRASLPDLSDVRLKGGDYDEEQLAQAVDKVGLVGDLVEHWQRHAGDRRTVAFAVNVQHSRHIVERFRAVGIAAEHLDGTTPAADRDAILRRLDRGETRIVSNCAVLTEGWDQPAVKCAILARPTKSTGLYLQCAGRILRPWNGEKAIILDHAGCALEHGLPQDERAFSLDGQKKRKRKPSEAPPCKTCESCFAVVPSATRECPECGAAFPVSDGERELEEQPGELVEVRPASLDEKRASWDEICARARSDHRSPGWAAHEYKRRYGTWPPRSFPSADYDPERAFTVKEKRAYHARLVAQCEELGHDPKWVLARYRGKFGEWPPREPTYAEAW
ncbi:DEAD/DEAH box helicase family protein [Pendulispora albinea]|uniref:DEAD/DEAH box helicase n=1 Tax=Pendulispora albinea TaxID=2741071 RepID=A0ABZ2LWW3_9BACT